MGEKKISLYKPTIKEEELLKNVFKRLVKMQEAKDSLKLESDWNKWEKQVAPGEATRSNELKLKNPSKVRKSLTREAVFMVLAMASSRNSQIQLIAQSDEDVKISVVYQKIMEFLEDKANEKVKKIKNILTTIIYGTGIRKRIYRSDSREVEKIIDYNPDTEKVKTEKKTIKDYDDIDMQDVDIRMFYVDERATSMEDAIDCAERKIIPYEFFKYEYPENKYPNAKYVKPGSWYAGVDDEKRSEKVFQIVSGDEVEIIEYYNKLQDKKAIIASGVVLKNIPIPYNHKELPYSRSIFQLRDGQNFWGIGMPELVEHDQASLDTLFNIFIDWLKLSINKPCLVSGDESSLDDTLVLEPGKRIEVNDPNNFKFLEIPDVSHSFFEGLQKVEENAKRKVGMDDPLYGVKSGGTATENTIAAQAARTKLELFFTLLEEDTEVRDARLKLSLIQQFYSQPVRIKNIVGDDGEKIEIPEYRKLPLNIEQTKNEMGETQYSETRGKYFSLSPQSLGVFDDRFAEFEVKVKSRSSMPLSKELRQQKWNETLQTISKIPEFTQQANWEELWLKTGEIAEFDAEKFRKKLNPDEEIARLAEEENQRMIKGEQIPPTQSATPEHTERHRMLALSDDMKQLSEEIQQIIIAHYEGELGQEKQMAKRQPMMAEQPMSQEQPVMMGGGQLQ